MAAVSTVVAALVIAGWPDLNTLSVRLVMATAVLFAFPTAVAAQHLRSARFPRGETSLRQPPRRAKAEVVARHIDFGRFDVVCDHFLGDAPPSIVNRGPRPVGADQHQSTVVADSERSAMADIVQRPPYAGQRCRRTVRSGLRARAADASPHGPGHR